MRSLRAADGNICLCGALHCMLEYIGLGDLDDLGRQFFLDCNGDAPRCDLIASDAREEIFRLAVVQAVRELCRKLSDELIQIQPGYCASRCRGCF